MSTRGSVSEWVASARQADPSALRNLWARYSPRLLRLARSKLPRAVRRTSDEEDLAVRAFTSFVTRIERGGFEDVQSRSTFWHILASIVARKASEDVRTLRRLKRGAGRVRGESALLEQTPQRSWDALVQAEPSPSGIFATREWFAELITQLADEELARILGYKCEGYNNVEISRMIGRSLPTVERRLRLIRAKLESLVNST